MDNDLSGFKQTKDVLMYYHTSIRNIGLYTSISLAGLSASRTFFKKNTTKIFTPDKNKLYISKNISEELDKDSILRHMPSNKKKERKNKNPWDL